MTDAEHDGAWDEDGVDERGSTSDARASEPPACSRCGRGIPPDAPSGNCPICLLELAALAPEPAGLDPRPPERFGEYTISEAIARGGMGLVWRARHETLGRDVALKTVAAGRLASPEEIERFYVEARAAARLDHPEIVAVHAVGEEEGFHFIAMELLEGGSLADRLASGPLAPRDAVRLVAAVARAVHFAHARGVLHRDLKPSNVLLDLAGVPHVADFGLARILEDDSGLTRSGTVLGSPAYMAPESALGGPREATVCSDVYSLGAILYELLSGRPPFDEATALETLRAVVERRPAPLRELAQRVDRDLETIVLHALEKDPAARYASAEELAADLERWERGEPIRARPAPHARRALAWARRRPALATLLLALSMAVALGITTVVTLWRRAEWNAGELRAEAYAADVFAASAALAAGDAGRARALLERYDDGGAASDLAGFEWRHLWAATAGDERLRLEEHDSNVVRAAFSPDGRFLATSSLDKTACIWRSEDGSLERRLRAESGALWSLFFSPDGATLWTGGSDGRLRAWSTGSWQPTGVELEGTLAALSPDGKLVALTRASPWWWVGKPEPLVVRELAGGRVLAMPQHASRAVTFAADSRTIAFAGAEGFVHVHDAVDDRELVTLRVGGPAWSLSFSSDDSFLAVAGWNSEAEVWDWRGGTLAARLGGHDGRVWCVTFSPDGASLATTASDQRVRLWRSSDFTQVATLRGHRSEVWWAAFSRDGSALATVGKDGVALVFALPPPATPPLVRHNPYVPPLFSPDGSYLVTSELRAGRSVAVVRRADTAEMIEELPGRSPIGFDDGAGASAALFLAEEGGAATEQRVPGEATPLRRTLLAPPLGRSLPALRAWSPSAGRLAVPGDGGVRVWDLRTGEEVAFWIHTLGALRSIALSPDGRIAVLGPEGELIENRYGAVVRELDSGDEHRLLGHRDTAQGLAFSRDGRVLATASLDATIRLWRVATGEEIMRLAGHLEDAIAVAFSADGRTLASLGTGRDVKLWHLATGRELLAIAVPEAGDFLAFSPDGRWLAVNTLGGVLRRFEAPPAR